jgi:hypothetical protein
MSRRSKRETKRFVREHNQEVQRVEESMVRRGETECRLGRARRAIGMVAHLVATLEEES